MSKWNGWSTFIKQNCFWNNKYNIYKSTIQSQNKIQNDKTYPDSSFCQICPCRNFLPSGHIRIAVSSECCFQLLKLLTREMSPLSALTLFLFVVFRSTVFAFLFRNIDGVCKLKKITIYQTPKITTEFNTCICLTKIPASINTELQPVKLRIE